MLRRRRDAGAFGAAHPCGRELGDALGVVTDGSIRDIPMIAPGFQMLAAAIVPSHAYVHAVDFGLDVEVADRPVEVAPNLWAQEVNALHELESHWERIHNYLTTLFASQGVDDIVAEELAKRFSLPQWRFTNSGTESTLDAVRIARGFTGRERLVKIEASYHGHHDALMVSVEPPPDKMGPPDAPASVAQSEGIPKAVVELTTVVPFNDLPALERAFKRYPDDIAAVIVEPAMMNLGIVLPDAGYLVGIKEMAHRNGALLIFDEVKTGVTIAPGGATERFGVVPDLIALAKAIGGGLPCGAVGGRQDVMAVIEDKRVAQMGTFNGNPLTLAAAKVTLQDILTPKAYAHFDALAEVLQGGLDSAIAENSLPFHVITLAARGGITYRAERVRNYRDYLTTDKQTAYLSWLYQCNRGVLMAPGAEENWTLSVQHSQEDVQRYVDNFTEMARDLRA